MGRYFWDQQGLKHRKSGVFGSQPVAYVFWLPILVPWTRFLAVRMRIGHQADPGVKAVKF